MLLIWLNGCLLHQENITKVLFEGLVAIKRPELAGIREINQFLHYIIFMVDKTTSIFDTDISISICHSTLIVFGFAFAGRH